MTNGRLVGLVGATALVLACASANSPPDGAASDAMGGASGAAGAGGLRWFRTCGDPICRIVDDAGSPDAGLPACAGGIEGAFCHDAGVTCDPGIGCNVKLQCSAESPISPVGCPISRRDAKQGINYLDQQSIAKLSAALQSLRLATYQYKADPSRERLGFILDDVPASSVLKEPGSQVDLYGYISLAVAALQDQKRHLDAQERELARLRREVAQLQSDYRKGPRRHSQGAARRAERWDVP